MMRKSKIWFVIATLIVVVIGIVYVSTQRKPELRSSRGFAWVKHWDELELGTVKKNYQRYTVDEMRILWDVKLHDKFGSYSGKAHAETVYPWDAYLARLLELGHPFIDLSDYESALDTRMSLLIRTRTYWQTMNRDERDAYINTLGLSPDASWEKYEESLIKQIVVYRINWWRSILHN